jgi:diguanylate cyclase (GGDEF)-like protein/PAS domain S-box-containing protein
MDSFRDAIDNLNLGVCFLNAEKKITYWNKGAENLTGFLANEVMGKKFGLLKENCPIGKTLEDGEQRESEAYLKNKNGKKLHFSVRVTPTRDEADKVIGANVMFFDISSQIVLINKIRELERSASFDALTKLPNRRLFEKNLLARFEEMQRHKRVFGIVFMDIDNFKFINDSYGHDVGDLVLKMVAKKLSDSLRPYDMIGRWGGEEFVALVPYVSREQLHVISNRMRSMVDRMSVFTGDSILKVTLSIGATLAKPEDTIDSIIRRADKLMYISKNNGKNKVTLEIKN